MKDVLKNAYSITLVDNQDEMLPNNRNETTTKFVILINYFGDNMEPVELDGVLSTVEYENIKAYLDDYQGIKSHSHSDFDNSKQYSYDISKSLSHPDLEKAIERFANVPKLEDIFIKNKPPEQPSNFLGEPIVKDFLDTSLINEITFYSDPSSGEHQLLVELSTGDVCHLDVSKDEFGQFLNDTFFINADVDSIQDIHAEGDAYYKFEQPNLASSLLEYIHSQDTFQFQNQISHDFVNGLIEEVKGLTPSELDAIVEENGIYNTDKEYRLDENLSDWQKEIEDAWDDEGLEPPGDL